MRMLASTLEKSGHRRRYAHQPEVSKTMEWRDLCLLLSISFEASRAVADLDPGIVDLMGTRIPYVIVGCVLENVC